MKAIAAAILTSAAVAAVISSLMGLLGQKLERASRREELIFSSALEMARRRQDVLMKIVEQKLASNDFGALIHDDVALAVQYHRWLTQLLDQGSLPSDAPTMPARADQLAD